MDFIVKDLVKEKHHTVLINAILQNVHVAKVKK